MSDYTINDIKVAAYNWTELPDMTVEERALWYSLGYWYEQYRADPSLKAECEKHVNGYVELFLNVLMGRYV